MDRELIQDYLQRTGMKDAQAEALSRILDQLATKELLRHEIALLEARIDKKLEALKADLTWRMIAMTVFLAALMTVLNFFSPA